MTFFALFINQARVIASLWKLCTRKVIRTSHCRLSNPSDLLIWMEDAPSRSIAYSSITLFWKTDMEVRAEQENALKNQVFLAASFVFVFMFFICNLRTAVLQNKQFFLQLKCLHAWRELGCTLTGKWKQCKQNICILSSSLRNGKSTTSSTSNYDSIAIPYM